MNRKDIMGRKKETQTPVVQKLKTLEGSPELVHDAKNSETLVKPEVVKRSSSRVCKIQPKLLENRQNKKTKASSNRAILNTDKTETVTSELSPKMFYSKKGLTRSAKSVKDDCASSNIPSRMTRSKKTVPIVEDQEALEEIDNDAPGISPKQFYSRSRKCSQVQSVPKVLSKEMKLTEKPVRSKHTSTKQQSSEMAVQQILSKLTDSPKNKKLFPVAEVLESIVEDDCPTKNTKVSRLKDNSSKTSANNASTIKAPKVTANTSLRNSVNTPAQTTSKAEVTRRKCSSRLTVAEIVAEVSTEGASGLVKSTGSDTKTDSTTSSVNSEPNEDLGFAELKSKITQRMTTQSSRKRKTPTKKSSSKKLSGSVDDDLEKSLLPVTDDLDSSKNVYDFEEFQVGSSQASSRKSTSQQNSNSKIQSSAEKNLSVKKIAAIKAVFNNKKKKVPTGLIKKIKVKTATKTVQPKRKTAVNKAVPVNGYSHQSEKKQFLVTERMSITPLDQILNEVPSFREIEKEKVMKHKENKIVSKIKPVSNQQGTVANNAVPGASIWPYLAAVASKTYTQLKRSPMEGPSPADILKVKQSVIPKCLPPVRKTISKSSDKMVGAKKPPQSSISGFTKQQIVECDKLGLKLNDPPPIGDTDNHIDLFTYPVLVSKIKKTKTDKNDKLKENKATPSKGFMDFLYVGSVERYLKPSKKSVLEKANTSPSAVMLPKFLTADTSTPNSSLANNNKPPAKGFGMDSLSISPVKDFQSPSSMRTYAHVSSRRSSLQLLCRSHIDEIKDNNVPPVKKNTHKSKKGKKEFVQKNKDMEKWAERMSNEFDEIENFELSIEE